MSFLLLVGFFFLSEVWVLHGSPDGLVKVIVRQAAHEKAPGRISQLCVDKMKRKTKCFMKKENRSSFK